MKTLIAFALLIASDAEPGFKTAIRCIGKDTVASGGPSGRSVKDFDRVVILQEHDRILTVWDDYLGRDASICGDEAKRCTVDFSPRTITFESDITPSESIFGHINRVTGAYWGVSVSGENIVETQAVCKKTDVPTAATPARAF